MGQDIRLKDDEVLCCKKTQTETIHERQGRRKLKPRSVIVIEKGFYSIEKYTQPYYTLKKIDAKEDEEGYKILDLRLLTLMREKIVHVARLPVKK
jgi:hypothetical protein